LKGFVITQGEPFIWVYKRAEPYNPGSGKITSNPYKDSIKIVGAERDFYANPGLSGANRFEAFENDLEALEKPANPILAKLVSGQPISRTVSPGGSKPATYGRFKTSHSEARTSYQLMRLVQG
jgi:hypothetical protein